MSDFIIEVNRKWKKADYTISKFIVDGGKFVCECVEDKDRGLDNSMSEGYIKSRKVYGKTAIPTGKYRVKMTYSPKFGQKASYSWCGGKLPELIGVKGFSGIRIHGGNTANDSEGCLLPGTNNVVGKVTNSMDALKKIVAMINDAIKQGRECWIWIH